MACNHWKDCGCHWDYLGFGLSNKLISVLLYKSLVRVIALKVLLGIGLKGETGITLNTLETKSRLFNFLNCFSQRIIQDENFKLTNH